MLQEKRRSLEEQIKKLDADKNALVAKITAAQAQLTQLRDEQAKLNQQVRVVEL